MKQILRLLVCFGMLCNYTYAQQEALFTHYMYNTLAVNPGYAGSRDALTITTLGRFQWVGFEGAPMTQTLTMHTPIAVKNIGLGLSVVHDQIGPVRNTAFYVDVAYRMKLTPKLKLCFGLKGGFNNFNVGLNALTIHDVGDVSFETGIRNRFLPNIGAGLYLQHEKYYVGISSPKMLENALYKNSVSANVNIGNEKRHYYFIAGGIMKLNRQLKFKPTVLAKMTFAAPAQADFTGNFILNDIFTFGFMYRTNAAFGGLMGVNLTEQFAIGYSFDWSTVNTTGRYNSGSHELMLRYDFVYEKEKRIKSPRYF